VFGSNSELRALAEVYARNLIEVTQLIHSVTDRKARRFADAFNMRKDS
jgi:catalase (peroxidase I)